MRLDGPEAAATISLGGLATTYDGTPHAVLVGVNPAGLGGRLTITYTRNTRVGVTAAVYLRHSYLEEKREALNAWASEVERLLE